MGLSIKKRIYWSFTLLVLMFVVNGIVTITTLNRSINMSGYISAVIDPSLQSLEDFQDMLVESKMYSTDWVFLRSNQEDKDALRKLHDPRYPTLKLRLKGLFTELEDKSFGDSINRIFTGFEQLHVIEKKIMRSLQKFEDYDDPVAKLEAERMIEDEVIPRSSGLSYALAKITTRVQDLRHQKNNDLENSFIRLRTLIAVLAVIIIGIGIFLSVYFSRTIIRPVDRIRNIVNNLGKGILQKSGHKETKDEIGEMVHAVNNLSGKLQQTANFAHEIGLKNFNVPFQPLGEDDVLGKALITMRDNLKKSDHKLLEANTEIQTIYNASLDAIIIIDDAGKILKWDNKSEILFGWKEEEVLGRSLTDNIIPSRYREAHKKGMSQFFNNAGRPVQAKTLEISALRKDNSEFDISLSISAVLIKDRYRFIGFIRDITSRKKAEIALQNAFNEKNTILESIADAFFTVDKKWVVTYWNKEAEKMLHTAKDKIVGHQLWEVFSDSIGSPSYIKYHEAVETNKLIHFEDYYPPLGKWYEISAYPSTAGLSVYFKDVTERRKSEEAIRKVYEEKNTVLESIDDGFFATDKNSIVTYWNKKAEILLNAKKEDVIGKNLHDMFYRPDSTIFYDKYQEAIRENTTVHFEGLSKRTNKWFAVSAFASDTGLSVYFKDVTENKKAEEVIRLSNERYDMVTKATNDSIWDWDMITGKTLRTGDGFKRLFGYEIEEADKDDLFWSKLLHPEDLQGVKEVHSRLFNNPEEHYWEEKYRIMKANGQYAWVYDKGYIIRDKNGKAIRMIGATQDITQQKEQVSEITRIRHNLDSLINTTTDMIWSVDSDLRIIAANKAFSSTIEKVTKREVVEGSYVITPAFGQELMEKWILHYKRALSGEVFSIEESYEQEKQETLYNIISFSPIINSTGKVTGVACYAKDVTELKKSGDKLKELNSELNKRAEELAGSNTELERFAYIASHDLQEPLRMVSSFLQLLEKKYKGQIDETASKYIHFAVDGADRMKKLILDLLEYSRAGTSTDTLGDTDMNEVMQEVMSNMKTKVEESAATIEWTALPVLIHSRKTQMLQLMQNLVGNALKYNENKKPVVKIAVKDEEGSWLFSVKDNGIGIDPRFADKVFIIFQRLHNKSEYSGTGIGLSICKKIVDRHGGKIWTSSEEGKGSTFYFTIPKNKHKSTPIKS